MVNSSKHDGGDDGDSDEHETDVAERLNFDNLIKTLGEIIKRAQRRFFITEQQILNLYIDS